MGSLIKIQTALKWNPGDGISMFLNAGCKKRQHENTRHMPPLIHEIMPMAGIMIMPGQDTTKLNQGASDRCFTICPSSGKIRLPQASLQGVKTSRHAKDDGVFNNPGRGLGHDGRRINLLKT